MSGIGRKAEVDDHALLGFESWLGCRLDFCCPGLAMTLTVLAFNLLGDGIRDRHDPRLRGSG